MQYFLLFFHLTTASSSKRSKSKFCSCIFHLNRYAIETYHFRVMNLLQCIFYTLLAIICLHSNFNVIFDLFEYLKIFYIIYYIWIGCFKITMCIIFSLNFIWPVVKTALTHSNTQAVMKELTPTNSFENEQGDCIKACTCRPLCLGLFMIDVRVVQ